MNPVRPLVPRVARDLRAGLDVTFDLQALHERPIPTSAKLPRTPSLVEKQQALPELSKIDWSNRPVSRRRYSHKNEVGR